MKTTSIRVAEFSRHLVGRDLGKQIREKHFGPRASAWPSELDFSDVEQATESCIDELLGTLAKSHGVDAVTQIQLVGATPVVQDTIDYVVMLIRRPRRRPSTEAIRALLKKPTKS